MRFQIAQAWTGPWDSPCCWSFPIIGLLLCRCSDHPGWGMIQAQFLGITVSIEWGIDANLA